MRLPALLLVALLAGCAQAPEPAPAAPLTLAPEPEPTYALALRVTEERPDGPAIPGAQVHVGVLDTDGRLVGSPTLRLADAGGWVRLEWRSPVEVAVQAVAPDAAAWTVEGARIAVADAVLADRPLAVSERDVFLPLYRARLAFEVGTTWGNAVAQVRPDGMVDAVHTEAALPFPEGLQAAYLARLGAARVQLAWEDTATARADLAAGLAWDGAVWAEGEPSGPGLLPGPRSAEFSGALPEARPGDLAAATLQAAAVTRTAVVGDVPLAFTVELSFSDARPQEMPDPRCGHRAAATACLLPG